MTRSKPERLVLIGDVVAWADEDGALKALELWPQLAFQPQFLFIDAVHGIEHVRVESIRIGQQVAPQIGAGALSARLFRLEELRLHLQEAKAAAAEGRELEIVVKDAARPVLELDLPACDLGTRIRVDLSAPPRWLGLVSGIAVAFAGPRCKELR